ncbi:MAG TPA: NUDIX hydrolase [Candidatus Saccharimonadia bacterium]|nr:NUDIX hydrolase [Candidatus Saccharimonadia bacterium]
MTQPLSNPLQDASSEDLLAEIEHRYLPNDQKPFPVEMFTFLNKFRPAMTVEIVVFRRTAGKSEVLILQRDPSEIGYAGKSHLPGGYLFFKETVHACLNRIAQRELGAAPAKLSYAGALFDRYEVRGHHIHHTFVAELDGEPAKGEWVSPENLPINFVPHHVPVVKMAAAVSEGTMPPGQFVEYEP